VAATVLLPFFFMATGQRALIEPHSAAFLGVFIAATVTTMLGKVVRVAIRARAAGERWPFALALGSLMQSKGLIEVVVLAVLLDAGLIGQTVYSALVAIAVACCVQSRGDLPSTDIAAGDRADIAVADVALLVGKPPPVADREGFVHCATRRPILAWPCHATGR